MIRTAKRSKSNVSTIEGLATLMVAEFSDLREEIDVFKTDVNTRFDTVNDRFDRIEVLLKDLDTRVSALEMKVSGVYRQLSEDKMQRLDVQHLMNRVAKVEEKVYKK